MELDSSSAPDRVPWGLKSGCPWLRLQWRGQQHLLWLPEMVRGRLPGQPCDSVRLGCCPCQQYEGAPLSPTEGLGG